MSRSRAAGTVLSVAVVLILASLSWNALSFNDDTYYPEDVEAAWQSIVEITVRYTVDENEGGGVLNLVIRGTGFLIGYEGSKAILTNAHVVTMYEGMTVNEIELDGYTMREGTLRITYNFHAPNRNRSEMMGLSLIRYDLAVDLAILSFQGRVPDAPVLEFVDEDSLRVGQDAFTIGNSSGNGLRFSEGKIRALFSRVRWIGENTVTAISTTVPIYHGNSGGPLIVNGGFVVGVISAGRASSDGGASAISYAVPTSTINTFLNAE